MASKKKKKKQCIKEILEISFSEKMCRGAKLNKVD